VINAVRETLLYFEANREQIFAAEGEEGDLPLRDPTGQETPETTEQ
jgi:hypothetical protein